MKRIITLLAATLLGFSQMMADPTAQTIPGNLDPSNGTYSSGSWNGTNTTDVPAGGTATYILNNATEQAYKITINAVSRNANAQMRVTIKNGETTVSERTITTFATNGWTNYQDFVCITSQLPIADGLTMEIKFLTNQTNIKSINFVAATSADLQIPTDYTHPFDLVFATVSGSGGKIGTNGRTDSFKHGYTATVNFTNNTEQFYKISFKAATNQNNAKVKMIVKKGEDVVSDGAEVAITNGGWNSYTAYECYTKAKLPTGSLTLVISMTSSSGSWTANVGDISFTALDNVALNESTDYTPEAKFANVTLTRSITANKWSTIVLPFAVADVEAVFGSGTKVAQLTSASNEALTFTNVTAMNANEPYMIKVTSDFTSATVDGVDIVSGTPSKTVEPATFTGVYASGTIPTGAYFVSNNKLYKATGAGNTIKPFRGYFTLAASAPQLQMIFEGQTTGIIAVEQETEDMDDSVYNLNGQRIAQPAKGLYIVNGKKVIVK